MNEQAGEWSLSIERGANLTADELVTILTCQHERMIATWESLSTDQWDEPSRNVGWTVHESARHVADVIECVSTLAGDDPPIYDRSRFDPNSTPDIWLKRSEHEPTARTIERYEAAATRYRERIAKLFELGDEGVEWTPYGSAHWTMSVVHGFWDGWLHERDMGLPLGLSVDSSAGEQRLVALYGMFMAIVPSLMTDASFGVAVRFTGPVNGTVVASHEKGLVTSAESSGADTELTGDLCAVVDSLSGRGAKLLEALPGAPQPLGWLAGILNP